MALFRVHRNHIIPPASFEDFTAGDNLDVFYGAVAHPDQLHYGAAVLFFLCIFIFTAVFFPRGEQGWTKRKAIYYLCAALMAAAILRMVPYALAPKDDSEALVLRFGAHFLFIWESVAILAFSFAWLAKGKADEPIAAGMSAVKRRIID